MTAPLYRDPSRPRSAPPGCNLGLWYTRFFGDYNHEWRLDEDAKRRWIDGAVRYDHESDLSTLAEAHAKRHITLVRSNGGELRGLETSWHFATGLGLPHLVENGFSWHHTLGLPYLKATGVKGLLSAWLHLSARDEDESEERQSEAARKRRHWCGEQDHAGALIFFDAIPTRPPTLAADVMTPHMGQWYAQGNTIRDVDREAQKVPADWHSPIPVPFLVAKKATFLFGIAPRPGADWQDRDPKTEVEAALEELQAALATLGAGAKTAVGYGRFRPGRSLLDKILEGEAEIYLEKAKARERAEELATFEYFAPKVSELLGEGDLVGLTTIVIKAADDGPWPSGDRGLLADRLKAWMIRRGEWVADAEKKRKKAPRNRKIRNTLQVMEWLPER